MKNQQRIDKILKLYGEYVNDISDLVGDNPPSPLFYILAKKFSYLLTNEPKDLFSKQCIQNRKFVNKILKKIGPLFLSCKQVFEDRKEIDNLYFEEEFVLPDAPIIWVSNHHFKDDALGTVLAAKRNAWFLFGSLPQFYNTFDGITAWLNGLVLVNRKNKKSKQRAFEACKQALLNGVDLIVYPEGVWNKTPEKLILPLWSGFYKMAKETGAYIVPVVHYKRDFYKTDKNDVIHTIIDNPIKIGEYDEAEAIELVRNKMATWYFLLMEKYGKSTRADELYEYKDGREYWENCIKQLVSTADRYDTPMEISADYRSKYISEGEKAWKDVASIKNVLPDNAKNIVRAKEYIRQLYIDDYQRRF